MREHSMRLCWLVIQITKRPLCMGGIFPMKQGIQSLMIELESIRKRLRQVLLLVTLQREYMK
jgi:hypothetical protein